MPCLRRCAMSSTASPNQQGVARLDSEVVWIFTEPSAILVISTSLLRIVVFFLFKEAYFYADWLPVTSRCAIRGRVGQVRQDIRLQVVAYLVRFPLRGVEQALHAIR